MTDNEKTLRLGIDIGSTTVKLALLDESGEILFKRYARHMSNVFEKVAELTAELAAQFHGLSVRAAVTGSGGLSISQLLGLPFEQEVIACSRAVEERIPQADVAIELGGEDAKITFYGQAVEQRMNGTCAGGTGAFIDQMAILLNTDAAGLDEAAKGYTIIYPIAARCGVFAKTDIQPLINEGANRSDLAASIFQAVVNQTISGLACGHVIRGTVAFLGGPLSFLGELRRRFVETLGLGEGQYIFPDDARYFVALGAAMIAENAPPVPVSELLGRIGRADISELPSPRHIPPLFENEEDYRVFCERHGRSRVDRRELSEVTGPLYLGIDAGSTTTKAVAIDPDRRVAYMYYVGNEGNPLEAVRRMLRELYERMPEGAFIANAAVTGYGEGLIKTGFSVDDSEIETIAHYRAAEHFQPGVDFILDIGGQDMKCMRIRDGSIYSIMLNEACSSGCGSFIETYARSVGMDAAAFAREGLFAENPVDLGTRCTVFMNSRVKQAQKEGATIGDITAGLSYSVIKNALYKVIKLRNPDDAGERIVVQGGAFLNDAVLRSIERILGREVVRPDIAGHMGAYGAALIALANDRDRGQGRARSSILSSQELDAFTCETAHTRCRGCENSCLLTINRFSGGDRFVTGNRCEKGAGAARLSANVPNIVREKYLRLFSPERYPTVDGRPDKEGRPVVGIPRVLNMYENYPFWHTFFTELGYAVLLSPPSSRQIYELGMETISSDTACYPAKLVHGHIRWLAQRFPSFIFHPSINYERSEDKTANNHYNCPIVATYPEVIAGNMREVFEETGVRYLHPFLPYDNDRRLSARLYEELSETGVSAARIAAAVRAARAEDARFKDDVREMGKRALGEIRDRDLKGVVLAGRPYHLDPEVSHGIDTMITGFGIAVLTEDSVASQGILPRPLRVLDQWTYHNRLYRAAEFTGRNDRLELVQLTSFGCGLDAVTTDQVEEILSAKSKLYTLLKIDEGANLGAARIRIRSLRAAMLERSRGRIQIVRDAIYRFRRRVFSRAMRKDYTVLMPQMAPIHFNFLEAAFRNNGYKAKLLPVVDSGAVDEGLKYVNNDACYPTIVTLGQIISYLKSGECDLDKTAVFMSQTGGGCRASNYIALLRKALRDLGWPQIPVVSVSLVGMEKNPGYAMTPKFLLDAVMALVFGDTLMRVLFATRPYEKVKGSAQKLADKWTKRICAEIPHMNPVRYRRYLRGMVADFDALETLDIKKPKVGVVGEILVKYHPNANNDIVGIIEDEGGEAVVLDLVDFFLYCMYSGDFNYRVLAGTIKAKRINDLSIALIEWLRKPARQALEDSRRFPQPIRIADLAGKAQKIASLGNQCGEGWLLAGEMVELIDSGVENIVCMQPFACLPNHVTGKGMIKPLREYDPRANIAAIDYDPGASEVNQLNRIKLMMSTAHKNLRMGSARNVGDKDAGTASARP